MKKLCIIVFMTLTLVSALSGCVTKSSEKAQYTDISVQQAKEISIKVKFSSWVCVLRMNIKPGISEILR